MKNEDWINVTEACALLGVRPQTLYAYVSRKLLRSSKHPSDARRSLYSRHDVDVLVLRHRRPRARREVAAKAIRWGDPVLDTAISGIHDGTLYFGNRPAVDCASTMTLEEIAAHHCCIPVGKAPKTTFDRLTMTSPLERALSHLTAQSCKGESMSGQTRETLGREGAKLMSVVANAFIGGQDTGPIHIRLSRAWGLNDAQSEIIRTALVLLSDHELNPSTFAVRVCASTGTSMPGAILAGLTALSGTRHGGVAAKTLEGLTASIAGDIATERFLQENFDLTPYAFGYGHPLYPAGDPRAFYLLAMLPEGTPAVAAAAEFAKRLGKDPNIDTALAICVLALDLPRDAAFAIFAISRMAGWIAHAIEQVESGHIIRPRARFVLGCKRFL